MQNPTPRPEDPVSPRDPAHPGSPSAPVSAAPAQEDVVPAPVPPASAEEGPASAMRLRGVCLGYGGTRVVGPLDLDIPAARATSIIGANGCGKSTLLRGLTRQLPLLDGSIEVDGEDIAARSARAYARAVSLLPQSPVVPEGLSVEQLVDRGRHPHRSWFGARTARDDEVIASALRRTDLVELADRDIAELSGGQRQRVWLALVLAQETPIVLLDEPTSYLDMSHQVELLDLVRSLPDPRDPSGRRRATTVAVLHELNMAARASDHVIAMARGQVVAAGNPAEVIVPEVLAEVFDLEADVIADPLLGHPVVLARSKGQRAARERPTG